MYTHETKDFYNDCTEGFIVSHEFFSGIGYGCTSSHMISLRKPKKKVYIVIDGDNTKTLRAMKVLKAYYGHYGHVIFHVDIAGYGRTYIADDMGFYDSKEDFANDNPTDIWDANSPILNAMAVAQDMHGYPIVNGVDGNYFIVRKWAWRGNCALYTESKFAITYDVVLGNVGIISSDKGEYRYRTKEEAINSNTLSVCEFEDEDDKTYDVRIEVIKTVTTSVHATSAESVLKTAKTAFGGVENFKVFIDGELLYERRTDGELPYGSK